jgi:RNA polymerase sigma factor (sigma-70 family)
MKATDERFLSLLRAEQGKLLRLARAITGQEHDAWDIVQESTLAAYRAFRRFAGGPDQFGHWIRRILINRCRDLLRARNRLLLLEPGADLGAADPDAGPEECLDHALLWREVDALEEHHRQVLTLRFLVDMRVEEIAELLDVPPGTVKSRLHRAVRALRKRLDSDQTGEVRTDESGAATQGHR